MDNGELQTLVEKFRVDEKQYAHMAVVVLDNKAAMKFLAVWTTFPVKWNRPVGDPPEELRALWDWLWTGVEFDWKTLAKHAGMDIVLLQREYESLRATRLIYPDGTIAGHAMGIIKNTVWKALGFKRE